jgi:hypothetical protein
MKYKNMVVIFLDMLGSKNMSSFEEKYRIHNLFHSEAKLNEDRQKNLSHVIYDRKIFSFSDCAYIFYFYKDGIEEHRKKDDKLISIAAYNTSLSILRFLNEGYLVRGGITFGEAYFDDLGFFGPGVEKAYELESKQAKVPKLMFDKATGMKVYNEEHNLENKDPRLLSLYSEIPFLIDTDDDDYFVNVFYELEKNPTLDIAEDTLSIDDVKNAIEKVVERDRKKFYDIPDIVEKLDWMQNYCNGKKCLLDLNKVTPIANFVPND